MKVVRSGAGLKKAGPVIMTLGNFDGVHLGHQRILKTIKKRAKALGASSAVYTFEPHPLKVVAPKRSPALILGTKKKVELIGSFGIDYLVLARFTKGFAAKHPRQFVEEEILPARVKEVWVGLDFSFGRARAGNVEYLKELGAEFGFNVRVIPAYKRRGLVVSSSRIRGLIKEGLVKEASSLMARPFCLTGRVVKGRQIGKRMGFPTANLRPGGELIPGNGVYAAWAVLREGAMLPAAVNIGHAPTFGAREKTIEVHLIGTQRKLYGRELEVRFIKKLRDETAFPSKEALMAQIGKDVRAAKKILKVKR